MGEIEKKIILFIVEGPSDEAALGSIMSDYFSNQMVRFEVVHGDITTKDYADINTILVRINDIIEEVEKKYHYNSDDFLQIIHLTDTDGVFIPDDCVKKGHSHEIEYFEDSMETPNLDKTLDRNHRKSEILYKLRKTGKIAQIPYRIYYNSCNLEHVLYGSLKDHSNRDKAQMADDFADKYEDNVDEFITFISGDEIAVSGSYQDSWEFIEEGKNSLNRHTNIHQLFVSEP